MANKDREIRLTREFDAPRELVFDAWTRPDKIGQWWGPNGFTTTTHNMDFRPGGVWEFIMHGPDGTDYSNRIVYTRIDEPNLITYDHGEKENEPPHFKVTVRFEDLGKKTRLHMNMLFPSKEARDKTVEFGAIEGAEQTLGRLNEFLK